jgi:Xaa-Pro aminopeptidase
VVQMANPAEVDAAGGEARYSTETLRSRIERVRERLDEIGCDALLVTNPYNRLYLTGFTGHDQPPLDTAGFLLVGRDDLCLVTDGRYGIQAGRELPSELGISTVIHQARIVGAMSDEVKGRGIRKLAFETAHILHLWWREFTEALSGVKLEPTRGLVEAMRATKSEDELAIIRHAIDISDRAFNAISERIEAGMTEKQVAWEIEKLMRDMGADEKAFGSIVAAGENGAMAHAVPGDRPLSEGEPIVIDMGAHLGGYSSDMTRTLCLGEPTDKFREIYNIVLEAHLKAEREIRPGMTGREADALARDVIAAAGYEEKFTHSLGHGIGLEVHESPSLRKTVEATVPAGCVTSIEPGIYIEGWGGVRIEDLVYVGENGTEVLTKANKHLEY